MSTLILTFAVFLIAVLAMVAGVLITGRSLRGSCGGPSCTCAREGHDITLCTDDRGPSLPVIQR
ncbi:MAG TPA: hypothetical protein VLT32_01670 [Candidatus Sulfomarinibacteraceae bacterium]|nr:hypothetical protein [Candidatus Sulfomarinibacteraceae bacterium]